jgi:radical SAM superfamily enzyme YgiQ (UPF0313 family)
MEKRYHLKLIQAANRRRWKWSTFPTLGLPMLASVTPSNYDVKIVDERVQYDNLNDNPDIVGISFECFRQKRAFKIADHYRKKGVKVIFGGVHTTASPESVLDHCDSAVVGEAEEMWPKVLKDFESGKLKRIYSQKDPVDLSRLPLPRMSLLDLKRYTPLYPVQSSRGCPHGCKFCFAKTINPVCRTFPVGYVVEQCRMAKSRNIVFVDDNFAANREHVIKVLKAITPFKKKIFFQANLYIGNDLGLLKIMRKAGCIGVFAGMESVNEASLKSVDKGFNKIKDYEVCIKNFKRYRIEPKVGVIFGFDNDTTDIFRNTLTFIRRNNLIGVASNFIIPYPGTEYYDILDKQNRIVCKKYNFYEGSHLIVIPKKMTVEELQKGYEFFIRELYSVKTLVKQILRNILNPSILFLLLFEWIYYYSMIKRDGMPFKEQP